MTEQEKTRKQIESRVISWHNDHQLWDYTVYNCGKLGIMELWFRTSWQTRWLALKPLPEEIMDEWLFEQIGIERKD